MGGYGSKEVQKNELFATISSHPGYGSSTEVIVGKMGVKMKTKFMEWNSLKGSIKTIIPTAYLTAEI